jgi:hypothetical protein
MKRPVATEIVKEYLERGPMQQFRLSNLTAFHCFRCGQAKKSKLIVTYGGNWDSLLCNGCYGRLLSIYEIKVGAKSDDEKASELADLLLSLFSKDQIKESERLFRISENRSDFLSVNARRFVATSERLSQVLRMDADLDWSPATIGLCKAVETEMVERLILPLKDRLQGIDLSADVRDKDIGRVAKFFADPATKPPELGSFAHFLQTSLNSESRRTTSPSVSGLFRLFSSLPNSAWLSNMNGLHESLVRLTHDFRNRAAHLDTLTRQDYEECRSFVLGTDGVLWKIIASTQTGRL